MASRRLRVRFPPIPLPNAGEDYIRNYNGPKVATIGRPIWRWHPEGLRPEGRGANGASSRGLDQCADAAPAQAGSATSSPLSSGLFVEHLLEEDIRGYRPSRRITVFQTVNDGCDSLCPLQPDRSAKPFAARRPRPYRVDSPARITGCNPVREGSTPSRLSWWTRLAGQLDHDGLVTLGSLIRSPHCVRFAGDPLRGAGRLGTTSA